MVLRVQRHTVSPEVARAQQIQTPNVGAQEITSAASSIVKAGTDITRMAQEASAETALANADAAVRELLFNPETGYYHSQGESAFRNAEVTKERIAGIQQAYGRELSGPARKAYERAIAKKNLDHFTRVDTHGIKGLRVWRETATKALVDNQTTWAYHNHNLLDEQTGHENFLAGRGQLVALLEEQGVDDPEEVKRQLRAYDSRFYSNAITGALNQGYGPAKEIFDKHGDKIQDKDTRERVLRELAQAKKREEEIVQSANATALAHQLVQRFDSQGEILDYIVGMRDKDLAARVTPEVLRLYSAYKNAREEKSAESFEIAEQYFREDPDASLGEFITNFPEQWDSLTESQKQDVRTRKVTSTDWTEYNRYLAMGDALVDISVDELTRTLAIPERKKIMDLRRKILSDKGLLPGSSREPEGFVVEPGISVSNARYTQQRVETILGPSSNWNRATKEKASELHRIIQEETRAAAMAKPNKRLSSQEYMQIVDDVTARQTLGGRTWFGLGGPREYNVGQLSPEEVKNNTEWLRANDLPVNSRTILSVSVRGGEQAERLNDPNSRLYRGLAQMLRDRGLVVSPRNLQLLYLTLDQLPE